MELLYSMVVEMRRRVLAPVDVAGCHTGGVNEFELLCSVILSSRTKDVVLGKVMGVLRGLPCTPRAVADVDSGVLVKMLEGVAFHTKKAEQLKKAAEIVLGLGGKVPSNMEQLSKIPGIGPKTGALYLTHTGAVTKIAVDTHVHRLFNRWGWVRTSDPVKTQEEAERWFPEEYRRDVNQIVVGFGQVICKAINPRCSVCLANKICPSSSSKAVTDIEVLVSEMKDERDLLLKEFNMPQQCKWGDIMTKW
jgi:endonuclease III